ncbi:ABC transporter ATP-binding protein [Chitinophaga oryzae]|nr:ABC transporter ATP-binding protein [Chitinophaga oryzae]
MKQKPKSGAARLLEIAGSKKYMLSLSALLAVLYALLSLIPYVLVYYILKAITMPPVDTALVLRYVIWGIAAMLAANAFLYASGMASHTAAFNILYELRMQMAAKLAKLPLGFINRNNSGVLKKIMADDIERLENFVAHSIPDLVKGITLPVLTLGYLFTVDWRLASVSCIPIVLLALIIPIMFNKKRLALMTAYHRSIEDMNTGIVEFVRAMPVIRIFGHDAESFERYSGRVDSFHAMVTQWNKESSPPFGIFISFASNATLPVLALGLYLYFSHGLQLSVLLLFLLLGVGYIRSLFSLSSLGSQLSVISHGVKRLDEVLFSEEQQAEGTALPGDGYDLRFKQVTFGYDENRTVLRNVTFDVPQGTVTALVGPSGSGKSTIAQLIPRFWDVQEGTVSIGGTDVKQMKPEALMQLVSFVFQDNFMFRQTIYDNIRMGMDKTEAEVVAAAKAAQCHDFIMAMPLGYQTLWGAGGVHLSGGEQQRIQLARAILKDAPVIVLDEATAFSDPENEFLIQQAFGKLIKHKTVVVIAHRLSTITNSDQIIVMEQGQVAGRGTHEELLQECALYQRMWDAHTRAKSFVI